MGSPVQHRFSFRRLLIGLCLGGLLLPAQVGATSIRIIERIYFQKESTRIPPRAAPILAEVARIMKSRPEVLLVELSGHCSRRERCRKRLALRRAKAVRRSLITLGVEAHRLVAVGYAARRPLTGGRTTIERQRNRRVEFKLRKHQ